MDCSPPGSSVHGIFQAGVLEWAAIAFSAVISQETVLVQTGPRHLFFMRLAMKEEEDGSWAWVRRLEEGPRREREGQDLG